MKELQRIVYHLYIGGDRITVRDLSEFMQNVLTAVPQCANYIIAKDDTGEGITFLGYSRVDPDVLEDTDSQSA
jgi:hypothetical protein